RREMSGVQELNLRAWYVLAESFSSRWNKKGIVFAPNRKQRWFRLAEIFLEFRIELYVRRIVQEQVELNLFIPRALEQCRVQCVRLRWNTFRIGYTIDVLPAGSSRCQDTLAEYVPVLCRGSSPILSNRVPGISKPFLVRVPVLRHN